MSKILIAFLLILSTGCGASAIERNVVGLSVSAGVLDVGLIAMTEACREDTLMVKPERISTCVRMLAVHDISRALWETWRASVVAAAADERALDLVKAIIPQLIQAYEEFADGLRSFGIDAPSMPDLILEILS